MSGGDIGEKPFEMDFHRGPCACRIMSLDRVQDGLMLGDRPPDPSLLRQGQPAIAIDVHFYLLNERPNAGISGDFRDCRVKHFIRVMEGVAVFGSVRLTLTFQDRVQNQNLAGRRALRLNALTPLSWWSARIVHPRSAASLRPADERRLWDGIR